MTDNFIYIDGDSITVDDTAVILRTEGVVRFGIDFETTALQPHDGEISLIQITPQKADGTKLATLVYDVLALGTGDILDPVRDLIEDPMKLKIAHNAKFEMKWARHHLDVNPAAFFDTMLASQIISAGEQTHQHSLEDAAFAFAGIELDKTEQTSDWSARPLSDSQIAYAVRDADVVLDIYPKQVERLIADDLLLTATIDFDAIRPIVKTELVGLHMDRDKWAALLEKKKADLAKLTDETMAMLQKGVDWAEPNPEKRGRRPVMPKKPVNYLRSKAGRATQLRPADKEFYGKKYAADMQQYERDMAEWQTAFEKWSALPDSVPATLNPGSWQQIQKVLKNVTGLHFESTRNDFLIEYEDSHPEVKKLIEYRSAKKGVESYGDNYMEASARDGRVRPDFKQILDTGRMSCREPNNQNIPHDPEHRGCFTAPRGRKLVIADYSQIELRLLAEFGADRNFLADFNSGIDMHKKGASRFFQVRIEDVDADLRYDAKRTNFGVIFGIGDDKLGRQIGKPGYVAGKIKKAYFRVYPGNEHYLSTANFGARTSLTARTSSGRLQRFQHDGSRGQIAGIGRNGQNMPIQGTGADMLKRAMYILDNTGRLDRFADADVVNIVHDELIVECNAEDAEAVSEIVAGAMIEAGEQYIQRVPVPVDAKPADSWAEKE
jgi:DNA polymerase I-like protein with 3'-5' exonuclease and polymerase domains